jgi:hypothetical protein
MIFHTEIAETTELIEEDICPIGLESFLFVGTSPTNKNPFSEFSVFSVRYKPLHYSIIPVFVPIFSGGSSYLPSHWPS